LLPHPRKGRGAELVAPSLFLMVPHGKLADKLAIPATGMPMQGALPWGGQCPSAVPDALALSIPDATAQRAPYYRAVRL